MSGLAQQVDADVSAVVEKVRSSLVEIRNGRRGSGAGTIWHAKGLIITNAHVVGNGDVRVTLPDGRALPGRVIAKDRGVDLAAVVVDATDLPTIQLGDSRALRAGQWVLAMGHPWGVPGAVSTGVVIGSGPAWSEAEEHRRDWLLVSLHLRPGHSGGPLVDVEGRLVGINTMINGPDVGVAIPVQDVKVFVRDALRA